MSDLSKIITKKTELNVSKVTDEALCGVEHVVKTAEASIDQTVAPIRKSILKRFPSLFLLAVTFGFTATVVGIEQILIQNEILQDHPTMISILGILILILTGTAYKKLG